MKKHKLLASILSMTMVFSIGISTTANAVENPNTDLWVIKTDSDGNTFLENTKTHEEMLKAFRLDASGNQIEIDLIEYAKTLNETTLIPTNTQEQLIVNDQLNNANNFQRTYVFIPFHTYSYTETRNYRTTGSPIKCTADMVGPCDITYGESETVSESFSVSITLSGEKSAIQAGASFGWEHSVQTMSSFSVAYNVPAGKIGYIQFKPYYSVSRKFDGYILDIPIH